MAIISCQVAFSTRFWSNRSDQEPNRQRLNCFKVNGNKSFATTQVDFLSQDHFMAVTPVENAQTLKQHSRQNIPTKKQSVDPYRQGIIVEEEYRQIVVVRSYEVGTDKTMTIESILSLLQETALNHVWMSGLLSDGFGATHGMMRNDLIWVVSRMQVRVDHYPIWGEVVEIDTWVGASGKNGMRRDWLLRSQATGLVFARATSKWVMMNKKTRRLSKMPGEVRAEISPWFVEKQAIEDESPEKINKLDNNARYELSDLKPKRSDLDMNHHVNNVKYVKWMLETIPDEFLENHQLSSITLEFRRECGSSDVVQSLSEPQETGLLRTGIQQCTCIGLNGHSMPFSYTHLLQIKGRSRNEEIVRGKTTWKERDHS